MKKVWCYVSNLVDETFLMIKKEMLIKSSCYKRFY